MGWMRRYWKVARFVWARISEMETIWSIASYFPPVGAGVVALGLGVTGWMLIGIVAAASVAVPIGGILLKRHTQEDWVRRITGTRVLTDQIIHQWLNDIEKRSLPELRLDMRHMRHTIERMARRQERIETHLCDHLMEEEEPDMAWTATGLVNRNGQINLGCPEPPRYGSDRFQYVFVMHCPECDRNYGTDGIDMFERRCPYHQGGIAGLPLCADEPDWRPIGKTDG